MVHSNLKDAKFANLKCTTYTQLIHLFIKLTQFVVDNYNLSLEGANYAKNSNLKNFESTLYSTSGSKP